MDKKILTLRTALQEKLTKIEALQKVLDEGGEERSLTTEENTELEKLTGEAQAIRSQITTLEKAAAELLATRGVLVNPVVTTPAQEFGEQQKRDIKKYSTLRALQKAAEGGTISLDGVEKEMQEEAIKELRASGAPYNPSAPNSFMIPGFIVNNRAVTATGTTSVTGDQGGVNVATSIMGNVESLDSAMVLTGVGASFITGLVGNYDFTVENDNFRPDWLTETGGASNKELTYGKKTLSPKRLAGVVRESSQILVQTSPSFEAIIRNKIVNGTALAIEYGAINGSGADNQPRGLLNTSGIISVVGGDNGLDINRNHLVKLVNGPGSNNYNGSNFAWLTNFSVRGKLMTTKVDEGSGLFLLNEDSKSLMGYKMAFTTNVPNNLTKGTSGAVCSAITYGDFGQLKIGQWGGINVIVDATSIREQGLIRLIVETFADALVLQPKAFAVMKDALTDISDL